MRCIKNAIKKFKAFIDAAADVKTGRDVTNRPLGRLLIGVAVFVVICTAIQTRFTYLSYVRNDETATYTNQTYKETLEIIKVLDPKIEINAGVDDGFGVFRKRIEALPGDVRRVQISFKNISDGYFSTIAGHIALPEALEYVSGSTIVYNRTNPDGIAGDDGIADEWIDLGGYNVYDEEENVGSGRVSFEVRTSENFDLFKDGVNTFNITCQLAGYRDGALVTENTENYVAYAAIDVIKNN